MGVDMNSMYEICIGDELTRQLNNRDVKHYFL